MPYNATYMLYTNISQIMQKFDHNIGFWENRNFFAENCRKSEKIVFITSIPEQKASKED
jgi:hypothetical protein